MLNSTIKKLHPKNILTLLGILCLTAFMAVSCSDDNSTGPIVDPVEVQAVEDIEAATGQRGTPGEYTFYSLQYNKIVTDSASTKWDIAFSGFGIIVNGGDNGPGNGAALILDVPFANVTTAPSEGYTKVTIDSWYNYTGESTPKHAVIPKENFTIMVKTANGNRYVKVEIISWYKGNPDVTSDEFANLQTRADGGYFTFKYKIIK